MTDAATADFTPEQRRYLEGLVAGMNAARAVVAAPPATTPTGPDAPQLIAQARIEAAGGKLTDQEKFKRDEHPFDTYERLKTHAAKGRVKCYREECRWLDIGRMDDYALAQEEFAQNEEAFLNGATPKKNLDNRSRRVHR